MVQHADAVDIIIIPPDTVDAVSDNEDLDDNVQLLRDVQPRDIAGKMEIKCVYNDEIEYMPLGADYDNTDDVNGPEVEEEEDETPVASSSSGRPRKSTSKPRKENKRPRTDDGMKPKWSRKQNYRFDKTPFDDTATSYKALYEQIGAMNPTQLWEMFIENEMLELLVSSSNQYAAANNCLSFVTTTTEMKTFLGVLYITGFHTLPQTHRYWSNRDSLGCEMIKN